MLYSLLGTCKINSVNPFEWLRLTLPSSLTDTKLSTELTTIFSQAVVSVQVKIDPKITVTLGEEFDDGESGMLSNYTGDMKKVINAYGHLQNETYYLFLVENPRSGNTALGYMPRSKQAGFIFVDNHGNDPEHLVRSMAHELSHGMFNLKHTFSEYSSLSRGATQNLMDYTPTGTELLKYQWDYVHDPQTVIPLFEGDEAGESYDCPMWFSGECETVGKILDLFKELAAKGKKMSTRSPKNPDNKELIAEDIELDGTEFNKIKIVNLVEEGKELVYNPRDFEEYSQQYLTAEGKADHQRGFVYRVSPKKENDFLTTPEPIIVKILLYENNEDFDEKLKALKKYLFGDQKEDETIAETNQKRYVVYKDDANVRSKVTPYNILKPDQFLQKGREVQIISQLVDGENPRSLVRYTGEIEEYCTWTGNLMEIISVADDQQYKLKNIMTSFVSPYSDETEEEIPISTILYVTHQCGDYRLINSKDGDVFKQLGWIKSDNLKRHIDNSKLGKDEFSKKFAEASYKAVETISSDWEANEAACNLCVRAALLNLTGDEVLFPTVGSSITIRDGGEQVKGKVKAGSGSAQGIIDDLKNGNLSDYFEEVVKTEVETYAQYWQRLQNMVDNNKEIIIGTYDPGHVFMIVPGGLHEVVDNSKRVESGLHLSDTRVELGDKWGGSFAIRNFDYVLRIMDCGAGVKFSNGPMYGVMDAKPMIGQKDGKVVKFYKYLSK